MLSRYVKNDHKVYKRPKGVSFNIEWLTRVVRNVGMSTFKNMPKRL